MTEEQVMVAMQVARWDSKQIRAMTYTSWKDGIDIERPCTALMDFVDIIAGHARAHSHGECKRKEGK